MSNIEHDSEGKRPERKLSHHRHGLMMLVGCLVPIALILLLPALGFNTAKYSSLAFLLCPLLHIGMMFMMRRSDHGKSCCKDTPKTEVE